MEAHSKFLLALGAILLLGLVTDFVGRRTPLPRVTLMLMFGVLIGKEVFNLIPTLFVDQFELITDMTLVMIGFLLGGKFNIQSLKGKKQQILWISIGAAVITTILVCIGLILIGVPVEIAILLGCISSATAPAATVDVVTELEYKGPFADLLLSVVALDDAWGLIIFSIGLATVTAISGVGDATSALFSVGFDIGGAIILGLLIGLPGVYLTGRIRPGQPMLTEALGLVFVCGGLAIWLGVSFLIASMVMGAMIANFARHHKYPFHAIEGIEWPFLVVFFTVAGASLDLSALKTIGLAGLVYIICRTIGKIVGATLGAYISNATVVTRRWIGIALLPQAGVAIGMALLAASQFPQYHQVLLSVIISTAILFEIIGPIFSRFTLKQVRSHNKQITGKNKS